MTILFQFGVCHFRGNETVTKLGIIWNGMMKVGGGQPYYYKCTVPLADIVLDQTNQ